VVIGGCLFEVGQGGGEGGGIGDDFGGFGTLLGGAEAGVGLLDAGFYGVVLALFYIGELFARGL
jgi:hypothetical protein